MKKHFINFLILLLSAYYSNCQNLDSTKVFQKDINNYTNAFNNKEWDKVISFIYPKLFNLVSKEEMIESFNIYDKIGLNLSFDFSTIDSISNYIIHNDTTYCRIFYPIIINLQLLDSFDPNIKTYLESSFSKLYGEDNFKYYNNSKTYKISTRQSMIAIYSKKEGVWKYFAYKTEMKSTLFRLLPEEVYIQINN